MRKISLMGVVGLSMLGLAADCPQAEHDETEKHAQPEEPDTSGDLPPATEPVDAGQHEERPTEMPPPVELDAGLDASADISDLGPRQDPSDEVPPNSPPGLDPRRVYVLCGVDGT